MNAVSLVAVAERLRSAVRMARMQLPTSPALQELEDAALDSAVLLDELLSTPTPWKEGDPAPVDATDIFRAGSA